MGEIGRVSRIGRRHGALWRATALAVTLTLGVLACSGSAGAAPGPRVLRLGGQVLRRCAARPLSYCGTLHVPLDYSAPAGPRISIAYRWYPATEPGGEAQGTVVPVEGGPGYPSIGSVEGGYSVMYGPLLKRWNMLAVDNRGTGASTPLDCPALQDFSGPTGTPAFQAAAGECASALNHRWRLPGGAWVHASDLFTSAPAARDLAAVITALGLPKVDLYGDSYGSFFAQVFASRFPGLVRSLILDSTYETADLDPWYRSTVNSMPADFDDACSRSTACAQAAPGSAWERIGELAASLREDPVSGVVPGPSGEQEEVSMGVVGLVDLVNDAAGDPQIYRELDASARALLDEDDPAPLLRLYAQRLALDEAYFGGSAREYSVESYLAVSCLDYPQLFDMSADEQTRSGELQAAEAALEPATFAPFSTAEWIAQDQNTEAYTACLGWPSPTSAEPPLDRGAPLLGSTMPVLVLGGEFDTWTPPSDIPKVLAEIGGDTRFIEIANSTHVAGEGDSACGSILVQEFVSDPQSLASLDASCAAATPPIHAVGSYPERLAQEPPIEAQAGTDPSLVARQLAAAGVDTAGDAIARHEATDLARDRGLWGGSARSNPAGTLITLQRDQLVPGVAVSGRIELSQGSNPLAGETVAASITVRAKGLPAARFNASWSTGDAQDRALVVGSFGREALAGALPAP